MINEAYKELTLMRSRGTPATSGTLRNRQACQSQSAYKEEQHVHPFVLRNHSAREGERSVANIARFCAACEAAEGLCTQSSFAKRGRNCWDYQLGNEGGFSGIRRW